MPISMSLPDQSSSSILPFLFLSRPPLPLSFPQSPRPHPAAPLPGGADPRPGLPDALESDMATSRPAPPGGPPLLSSDAEAHVLWTQPPGRSKQVLLAPTKAADIFSGGSRSSKYIRGGPLQYLLVNLSAGLAFSGVTALLAAVPPVVPTLSHYLLCTDDLPRV